MAWNEPGGGGRKDQDPWRGGGGGNDPNGPDIDEVIRKLQEKFNGLLGGKNNDEGGLGQLLGVLAVLAVVAFWLSGYYRVEQAEQAVVLRLGKFQSIETAGLHWNAPIIDEVQKINVIQVNSKSVKATMLTEDQNIVDMELVVQYRVADPRKFFLNNSNPLSSLENAIESALRHVVGGTPMDKVITEGRQAMGVEVQTRLQDYLDHYESGLQITKVNIDDAHPPTAVKEAFDDVIKAKEDEERLKNEAQAYANGIVPEAHGQASRILEEARAYREEVIAHAEGETQRFTQLLVEYKKAPEVTRQRLYLESMERVFDSSTKVLVDSKNGNNMLYLPLEKLMPTQPPTNNMQAATPMTAPDSSVSSSGMSTSSSASSPENVSGAERLRQFRDSSRWENR
ncbi:MAG TPA: FtsH protease activity modulator HflK [Pseudomonadales bacterium]|nr:FtsH protease activity modulator HflK [Pseudomonadales bacterium]